MHKKTKTKIKISIILKTSALAAVFAVVFLLPAAAQASAITGEVVVELVNKERTASGLPPLVSNGQLEKAASKKAGDMIEHNYFAHTSPEGITPWYWIEESGYDYKYAGENLAMDFSSAEAQHRAWMKSETHRQNILNSHYQEIGVAVQEGKLGDKETIVVVQMFGGESIPSTVSALEAGAVVAGSTGEALNAPVAQEHQKGEITIIAPENDSTLTASETRLIARVPALAEVTVYDRGIENGRVRADELGLVSYDFKDLEEGIHEFHLKARIADGGELSSAKIKVTVDTTAPVLQPEGIIALPWIADPAHRIVIMLSGRGISEMFVQTGVTLRPFTKIGENKLAVITEKADSYLLVARDGAGNTRRTHVSIGTRAGSDAPLAMGDQYHSKLKTAISGTAYVRDRSDHQLINHLVASLILLVVVLNAVLIGEKRRTDEGIASAGAA